MILHVDSRIARLWAVNKVCANVVERLGHFNLIVPSLVHNLMKQHTVCTEEASFAEGIFSSSATLGKRRKTTLLFHTIYLSFWGKFCTFLFFHD